MLFAIVVVVVATGCHRCLMKKEEVEYMYSIYVRGLVLSVVWWMGWDKSFPK
jgi:hypothetical protein